MQQAKTTLSIEATVFGRSDPPVTTTIPSTLKGAEIKNFLVFSHQMSIPEGSCIIIKLPPTTRGAKYAYHILDDDKDMQRYCQRINKFQILLFPQAIRLKIHCADGRVSTREYPAKTQSSQIVETVCQDFFHLKHNIAYALYGKINDLYNPIPQTKSILEYDPYLQDVWLLRRFWIKAGSTLKDESDIHFNYSHARNIVFAEDFQYQYYQWEDLIAISLTIEYSTYEQTKILLKKEKKDKSKQKKEDKKKEKKEKKEKKKALKKEKKAGIAHPEERQDQGLIQLEVSHFPKWMLSDKKIKKRKNEVIEKVKNYEGAEHLELKLKFLSYCLDNKFFGALMFPVRCIAPMTNNPIDDYILSFTEDKLHLLVKGTENDIFNVEHPYVKKWKPVNQEHLKFYFFPGGQEKFAPIEWEIQSPNVFAILDYFTSLVNFIKQQSILAMKDEQSMTERKATVRMTNSSLTDILAGNGMNTNIPMDEVGGPEDSHYDHDNKVLSRFDPPQHQAPTFLDISKITAQKESQSMFDEFSQFYVKESGFAYEPFTYPSLNDNVIESGCSLLRSIIIQESLSPIADATAWVQSCLPEDLLTQSVLGWQLQGPAENLFEAVSTISRCIAYVFQSELTPLDSFVALNYSRSLLLHFARQHWKDIDFGEMAEQVDESLGDVLRPVFSITRRLIYPLSTLVFEDSSDILPEARSMLFLNESIAMSLLFSAIAIARALCDAGILAEELQPILNTLPVVNTYDPVLAYNLSEALLPILNNLANSEKAQKALLSQAHVAKLDIANISNSVTELYNFSHFMASPVSVFCSVRSPRLLNIPETPSTIPEAAYVFQLAREAAITLWNIGTGKYGALAQQISWIAAQFYSLFIEAARDPSLANTLGMVFKDLVDCLTRASEIFMQTQGITDVLNNYDPVHSVILSLLNSEDSRTSLSLLALDSVSTKHRVAVLEESGKGIDNQLRSLSEKCSEEKIQEISDSFRVFSLMVLSLSRGNEETSKLRAKLSDFGTNLVMIMKEDMNEESRRAKAQELINIQRGFIAIGQGFNEFAQYEIIKEKLTRVTETTSYSTQYRVDTSSLGGAPSLIARGGRTLPPSLVGRSGGGGNNDMSTFTEIPVQIVAPDLSLNTDTLRKLANVLKLFVVQAVTETKA